MSFIFNPPESVSANAHVKNMAEYEAIYNESIKSPDSFWDARAQEYLHWFSPYDKVREFDYHKAEIAWFLNGKTNVSYNCLDQHLELRGNKPAIIWEGNEPGVDRTITYKELHTEVCTFANVLKNNGVKAGDRVTLYMPMIPELAIAMLACARVGAVHSIVFGGFSAEALNGRIEDCQSSVVVTTDFLLRGVKRVPMKTTVDTAVADLDFVSTVIVYQHTGDDVPMTEGRDLLWSDEVAKVDANCPAEPMDAEAPLFLLYTSGSTGKPKGVLHTTGGYNLYAAMTHKYVFDYHEEDIYWCTADIGWVTGHSYIVYGPLTNGATTIMFEGVPTYPDAGRFWEVCDKWKVNSFYTAPTAIRALAAQGTEYVEKYDLSTLRILGTVGEPINPEAWMWYFENVGKGKCPIVDTWWQTETGGILITPLPGAIPQKPGSATRPFFGVQPVILDPVSGKELEGATEGVLAIKEPWPGQMRGVYGDQQRFYDTYFSQYKGYYFSGDGCRRDEDGYYWITGRVDDVINISGHRMGTAEVESALVLHDAVAEAAVVGVPHEIKGWGIYAYVILNDGIEATPELQKELVQLVRAEIGPIATPDFIQFTPGLPKTRSGKIMRRILRKIVEGESDKIGDTSTLADPAVVNSLIKGCLIEG
ncbi:MAG: acetate--CoA ligase [Lentisphaeria bacterium]|nr:acetate--CoA ligase [Lentisphaeria bacterium]